MLSRRALLLAAALAPAARAQETIPGSSPGAKQPASGPRSGGPSGWAEIVRAGQGQDVYWNAWGGSDGTNAFIEWVAGRVHALHGIALHHVRLRDTADAVARIVAERAAGREHGGSVDMLWLNGPNFLALKRQDLLLGPILDQLPNAALVDRAGKPTTTVDFTVPTDGYEVPWRMAQVCFLRDADRLPDPPRSAEAILAWAAANPGRTTHPGARNFLGATFLKTALLELAPDTEALYAAPTDAAYAAATAPLWAWYGKLRPALWRAGKQFPESGPAQSSLLNDGEIDFAISFNPSEAATGIAAGTLPPSVRVSGLTRGTIGNASFNAVPRDAAHPEGAMLVLDFLLSPEAQAKGADIHMMGGGTVLDLARLSPADRALFAALPSSPALPKPGDLGPPLLEPHPGWMDRLAADWERRVAG